MAPARRAALAALMLAAATWARTPRARGGNDEESKIVLPHHSFAVPLEYKVLLDDWKVGAASIFMRDKLLLTPAVSARAGFAWNKQTVLTDNFEVIFQFRCAGKEIAEQPDDQSFAFWSVQENVSALYDEPKIIGAADWATGLRDQAMDFAGMLKKFNGFGVIFSSVREPKKSRVSYVGNDGSKILDMTKDAPSINSKDVDYRNTLNAASIKIRVKKDVVTVFFKQTPSLAWTEVMKVEKQAFLRPGNYIGFTSWSGEVKEGRTPDSITITNVTVSNYDDTTTGEELLDVSQEIREAFRDMLTDEHRHFLDEKSQTEHLMRLVKLVQEQADAAGPAEGKLVNDLQALTSRVNKLGQDCRELRQEAHVLLQLEPNGHADHMAGIKSLRNEIVGLRRVFVKDSAMAKQKLDAVSKNVQEVKVRRDAQANGGSKVDELHKQHEVLDKTVKSRGSQMSIMMFFLCASVVGIGVLMYARMHYYEKKHFL